MGVVTAKPTASTPVRERRRGFLFRVTGQFLGLLLGFVARVFGTLVVLIGLAIATAIPVVQFWTLGYLVKLSANLAERKPGWSLLPGVKRAIRPGLFIVGSALFLLPAFIMIGLAQDAQLIEPTSDTVRGWRRAALIVLLLGGTHVLLSLLRGAAPANLLHPLRNVWWFLTNVFRAATYREIVDRAVVATRAIRPLVYLSIGVRVYVGTALWLVVPALLFVLGKNASILWTIGGLLLAWIVTFLPAMQVRFAMEDRLSVFREVRAATEIGRRAPISLLLAQVVWFVLTVPFYILLAEPFPHGLLWLPALAFLLLALPSSWLFGWSVGRALRRGRRAPRWLRWPCGVLRFAICGLYAIIVFHSCFVSFRGEWAFFEHHGLLLPILG